MILFYDKKTGEIIGTVDGRVHDYISMGAFIDDGRGKENIGRLIIGIEETKEIEKYKEIPELEEISEIEFKELDPKERRRVAFQDWVDDGDGGEIPQTEFQYFKKKMVEVPVYKKIEHNLEQFDKVIEFESISPITTKDYKIINNKLIKK